MRYPSEASVLRAVRTRFAVRFRVHCASASGTGSSTSR